MTACWQWLAHINPSLFFCLFYMSFIIPNLISSFINKTFWAQTESEHQTLGRGTDWDLSSSLQFKLQKYFRLKVQSCGGQTACLSR